MTILAARRVVPPDLMAAGGAIADLEERHQTRDLPPRQGLVLAPEAREVGPAAGAVLKMRASRVQRSMMPPSLTRSSATD